MLLSVSLSHPDCEPEEVSDWSFDENCLFCCLRRERVKVGVITTIIPPSEKPLWLWASLDGFNVLSEAGGWHLFRLTTLRSSVQAEPGWCGALLLLFHLISSGSWTSRSRASPKPRCHPVIQLAISTSLEPNCSDGDCVIDRGSASCRIWLVPLVLQFQKQQPVLCWWRTGLCVNYIHAIPMFSSEEESTVKLSK